MDDVVIKKRRAMATTMARIMLMARIVMMMARIMIMARIVRMMAMSRPKKS